MADVFISYAREEQARAEEVRRALEALGLSVFFDVERLDAGDTWSDVIDRELKSAGGVVALWSPHALSRPWVKKECAVAQGRGVLLPALLEPVGDLEMPTQFADLQRVDLADFHGDPAHDGWRKLVRALAKTLKRKDLLAAQIEQLKEEKQTARVKADLEAAQKELEKLRKSRGGVRPAWVAAGLALVLALGGGAAWWAAGEMGRRDAAAKRELAATQEQAKADMRAIVEALKALSTVSDERMANADAQRLLDEVLKKVPLDRLEKAAEIDGAAALLAGWAHDLGAGGLEKNPAQAAGLYKKSCALGNLRGCRNLGVLYEDGEGVAKTRRVRRRSSSRPATAAMRRAASISAF